MDDATDTHEPASSDDEGAAAPESPIPPDPGGKQVRIALVMNGGVSLAVWMGGVTHEIDLLRLASKNLDTPDASIRSSLAAGDQKLFDAWRDLCVASGSRVVVDVVAGTSAGGLNGTLLATAIARGSAISRCLTEADTGERPEPPPAGPWLRDLWIERADLAQDKLLPDPGEPPNSVLDGRYFERTVEQAVNQIPLGSHPDEVDLHVTATIVGESNREYNDAFGSQYSVADHRRVHHFRREERALTYLPDQVDPQRRFEEHARNDFGSPSAPDADGNPGPTNLGRAARASASFPVAFEPVRSLLTLDRLAQHKDAQLTRPVPWMMDGGVLANEPFQPVLDTIAKRRVSGVFDRVLIYVVPSAGYHQPQVGSTDQAPAWPEVIGASSALPREVNFRLGIEQVRALQRDIVAGSRTSVELFGRLVTDPVALAAHLEAADRLMKTYVRARAEAAVVEAQVKHMSACGHEVPPGPIPNAEIDAIIALGPLWAPPADSEKVPLDLVPWRWGSSVADRSVRILLRYLADPLRAHASGAQIDAQARSTALAALSEALARVSAVDDAVGGVLGTAQLSVLDALTVAQRLQYAFERVRVTREVGRVVNEAVAAFAAVVGLDTSQVIKALLAVEVVGRAVGAAPQINRTAPFRFQRLGPDAQLTIFERGNGGNDAFDLRDKILWGTQAHHFGAFGLKEWRAWDWMLGRLDAVQHLGTLLGANVDWIRSRQADVIMTELSASDEVEAEIANLEAEIQSAAGDTDRANEVAARLTEAKAKALAAKLKAVEHSLNLMKAASLASMRTELSQQSPGVLAEVGDQVVRLASSAPPPAAKVTVPLAQMVGRTKTTNTPRWISLVRWAAGPVIAKGWRTLDPAADLTTNKAPWWLSRLLWLALLAASGAATGWVWVNTHGAQRYWLIGLGLLDLIVLVPLIVVLSIHLLVHLVRRSLA